MTIKTPTYPYIESLALSPKAGLRRARETAYLKAFPALPLGQRWPGHWPGQPGPNLAEPGAPSAPPSPPKSTAASLGRPLNIREVAALVGCSPWAVRQTLLSRGLPHFRLTASGRLTFFERQIVLWIEKQQRGGINK